MRRLPSSKSLQLGGPQQLPLWSQTVKTPTGDLTLAPESFILPPFAPGEHDALILHGQGDVTLTTLAQTPPVFGQPQRQQLRRRAPG